VSMPGCESIPMVYLPGDIPKECLRRTKHRGDVYCPPCNARLRREGKPIRGSVIEEGEWNRTWTTDEDRRGDGDERIWSRYTYEQWVDKFGQPKHDGGRDGCDRCEAAAVRLEEERVAQQVAREDRGRRAVEIEHQRKDLWD
jgi:hypothetical protein